MKLLFRMLICTGILIISQMYGQVNSFNVLDDLIKNADSLNALLLSPVNYSKGLELYKDAKNEMMERVAPEIINDKISRSKSYLDVAIKNAELAHNTFKNIIKARKDCENIQASRVAPDDWEKAEDLFNTTMKDFENNDMDDAKETASEAEKFYRQAELIAIKNNRLNTARELIKSADENEVGERAPVTLSKAKLFLQQAEEALNDNRYDSQKVNDLVTQTIYEAKHAVYLSKVIEKYQAEEKTWEDILVDGELPLDNLASFYNLEVKFDEGYSDAVSKITDYISRKDTEINSLRKQIENLNNSINAKNITIDSLTVTLENLTEKTEDIESKLSVIDKKNREFYQVDSSFTLSEAEVKREGNKILIRLISLNFEAGKSVIDPQYFALLSKVEKAINIFKGSIVTVEGHTDSQGPDNKNLTLSRERAEAVRKYLLANIDIDPSKILAVGKGESEPIANNETEEGRRKNRRIDIYIAPK